MPPSEKRSPPTNLVDTSIPTDSPPSYENTILPTSNPWTTDALPSQPSQTSQPTQSQQQQPPISIPSQNPLAALSRLTTIPYSKYRIRDSKLSDDQSITTTTSLELTTSSSSDSKILQRTVTKFLTEQASLPPKPIMVIRGTHLGSGTQHGSPIVDFELKFNLTSFLELGSDNDDDSSSGQGQSGVGGAVRAGATARRSDSKLKVTRYQHGSSNGSPKQLSREERNMSTLELWVKKFCEDKAENRSFTLTRNIPNLPTALLEGHIRTLLASTKYRGKLTVDFPVHYSSVTIVRKSSNWFTNMLRLYPTKKYEVLNVEWPVAGTSKRSTEGAEPDEGGADQNVAARRPDLQRNNTQTSANSDHHPPSSASSQTAGNSASQPDQSDRTGLAGLVAQAWWREWQFSIWNSVLAGKKGWVTVEDWIEAKMGVREKETPKEWGVDYE